MRPVLPVVLLPLLVAATVLVPASATAQTGVHYVALGDSYASGTGTRSYYPDSGACQRSPFAYPALWADQQHTASFSFDACAGATTDQLVATQLGQLSADTDLVTVSIGGNDAGFGRVMTTCNTRGAQACDDAIDAAQQYIATQLAGRLDAAYGAIRERAGAAEVIVFGYPQLFELGPCASPIDAERRDRLNVTADHLADVTADRATAAGFTFADTRSAFAGHRICANEEWINPPTWPLGESYHPNRNGHARGYLPVMGAATDQGRQQGSLELVAQR